MKLIELFDSRDKKKRLSHIKNLFSLACSDGSLDKNELDLIFKIAVKSGISPEELNRIMDRPESISFSAPESYRERIEQLYDMVLIMMADGEILETEMSLCKITAIKLGFSHSVIEKIIDDVVTMVAKGIATEIALAKLVSLAGR